MPFRPSKWLASRQERRLRADYRTQDDAGKRLFIQTILKECPTAHVGEFVIIDVRNFPKIGAPVVVFYVPTGAFRTDRREFDEVKEWVEFHLAALQKSFASRGN